MPFWLRKLPTYCTSPQPAQTGTPPPTATTNCSACRKGIASFFDPPPSLPYHPNQDLPSVPVKSFRSIFFSSAFSATRIQDTRILGYLQRDANPYPCFPHSQAGGSTCERATVELTASSLKLFTTSSQREARQPTLAIPYNTLLLPLRLTCGDTVVASPIQIGRRTTSSPRPSHGNCSAATD